MTGNWRYELALQRELDAAEEVLAGWVMEGFPLLETDLPLGEGAEAEDLTFHQLSQLVAVAEEVESVPAVISYLRYQLARPSGWKQADFGMAIIKWLNEDVKRQADNVALRVAERLRGENAGASDEEVRRAHVEVTKRFLATVRRAFVQRRNDMKHEEVGSR